MPQQRLTESHDKTQQRLAPRKTSQASAQLIQGGLHPLFQLQRTLGNRNVARLIQAKRLTPEGKILGLQRKLTVGAADDQYEQEADRVARQVMHTPDVVAAHAMQRAMSPEEDKDQLLQPKPLAASITPFMQRQMVHPEASEDPEQPVQAKLVTETSKAPVQRQPATEEDETEPLQAKAAGALTDSFEAGADVETQVSQSKGRGSPLPDPVRAYMEPRFGVDFSQVRVHTGSDAVHMNRDVGAQAFTHGADIYFGSGHSPTNLELTAHELTHVIQQTGSPPLQAKKRNEEVAPPGPEPSMQRICAACAADNREEKGSDLNAVASNSMQRAISPEEDKDQLLQPKPLAASITPFMQRQMVHPEASEDPEQPVQAKLVTETSKAPVQRQPATEEDETEPLQAKAAGALTDSFEAGADVETQVSQSKGRGSPLPDPVRAYMEPRFGVDFSQVRAHTGSDAVHMNRDVGAQAFTHGADIYFGSGHSPTNLELTAHELTHVIQQTGSPPLQTKKREQEVAPPGPGSSMQRICAACAADDREKKGSEPISPNVPGALQRKIGDGHDLTSPRFSLLEDLEAAYDNETVIRKGKSGRGVQAIQQALYDLGFALSGFGADGDFGSETKAAVKAFQRANPPLVDDGEVGFQTMAALNARFGAPVLPSSAARSAPWTGACVRSVLCPWSPHTIDVLRSRITLKSFDSISWADEKWDGASWIPDPFPGGGYNTGTEIGVLNSSCEEMSETLYHEVLHAEQPTSHSTTLMKESYAYRIGEEFSIALGLGGRPALRSTDAQGREFADPTKVGAFVATAYPSVPAGGGGDEVIGKAAAPGRVEVRRPDGSIYTRPAAIGEKVPGPITTVGEVVHPNVGWTCP